ncbi:MAG: Glucosamine/fructose-6-phosphate aminotransferase, isomerizing [Parcubacteria group bacterium GW2011_GWA2_44_12]|nr:MAG: Glucosamine/fructose-6-phosphate aminotransferase, isomerizing [Parcubacteria group bacterium GW2011_GWA2_44_12]
MCGIIAYIGSKNPSRVVIAGLKKLEYRGYDSWGVACFSENDVSIYKEVGKVGEYENTHVFENCTMALGQTRWATHGGVTLENAHPHVSQDRSIVIVQNGIVENYLALKEKLEKEGYVFRTETDTEVIANLLHFHRKKHSLFHAGRRAFDEIIGRNAIVFGERGGAELIAMRKGSPLILGIAEDGDFFIASDIPAFLEYTRKINYLDDGEMAVVRIGNPHELTVFSIASGNPIQKRLIEIEWNMDEAKKGKYKYFMIKEIMEQKETLRRVINQDEADFYDVVQAIKNAYGTFAVACGTAGYASMIGTYFFSEIAHKHINFTVASEFSNYVDFLTPETLMLVTTQSGETADVLEAMEAGTERGVKIVSLVNVVGSTVDRKSDKTLYLKAGPEQAVCSTKATTAHIALFLLLAYGVADKLAVGKRFLVDVASNVNDMLNPRYEEVIIRLAHQLKDSRDIYVIGRGISYPLALEIAHKIKEVSYIHAEGMAGGELKHGTLSLIETGTPVIVLTAEDKNKAAILSNAMEIKARGGYIIGIACEPHPLYDYFIKVPNIGFGFPVVSLIPGQMLAYHLAVLRGLNPDKPRNLAKSVTVK